tara:strand:- start:274 stop:927 length:654 start_codon:yes stop_codon:yes gene_type:complete
MSITLPDKWKPEKVRAIEVLVSNPGAKVVDVAKEAGVTRNTVFLWLKDPEFVEVFYQRYMVSFGSKLPGVLNSMIREAEAGNVQAGRLVLEHSGKLIKRVEVANHQSPFEKFLKSNEGNKEVDAVDADYEDVTDIQVLPQRPIVPKKTQQPTKRQQLKNLRAKQIQLKKRREAAKWKKRAKAVGIATLGHGRPTPAQKKAWQDKVIAKEEATRRNKG